MLVFFILIGLPATFGQASQWIDGFQKTLCHDRWSQMDWQSILRPCRNNLEFGKNKYDDKHETSPKWSHTLGLHFKKTGEFSKIAIQSRTGDGRPKSIGGDTWRVFIRGADRLTPFVSDLNNGVYEAKFIAIQPGFYKAEIVLESSLCKAFKDPPQDWLKRDARTILSDEKNTKLLWEPIRGGNISFKIEDSPNSVIKGLKRNFRRWKDSCGQQYKCDLLWKGFGRWVNSTWIPYIDDEEPNDSDEPDEERCYKQNEGVLKMTGDDLTRELFNATVDSELCNGVFTKCIGEKKGGQPNSEAYTERKSVSSKIFSTKQYLRNLKQLFTRNYMDENSGLVLNYGHPFVQNIGFKQYRSFIDRAVRIVKEKYKGSPVWRTMSSSWRESKLPQDYFKNHQRIKLFNTYATSAMCNAGIPVLDVYQMTESAPTNDKKAVIKQTAKLLTQYFRERPIKECVKKAETSRLSEIIKPDEVKTPATNSNFSVGDTTFSISQKSSDSTMPTAEVGPPLNNTVGSLFKIFEGDKKSNKT